MIASLIAVGLLMSIAMDALTPGYDISLRNRLKRFFHIGGSVHDGE